MEVATKIITVVGALAAVGGLGWAFVGSIEFFQGKKNGNPQATDNGMNGIIYGAGMAAVSGGIAAGIVAAINAIQF